jgi:hypothetical protein
VKLVHDSKLYLHLKNFNLFCEWEYFVTKSVDDTFESVRERPMPKIVEQPSHEHRRRIISLVSLIHICFMDRRIFECLQDEFLGQVADAQRVLESRVAGPRPDLVAETQLLEVAQTLKHWRVDHLPDFVVESNEIVNWIKNFSFFFGDKQPF